uniref:Uncharacterized protein n=1 Tax=Lepeophtheirus salmonis TaxID=72036 RepID=A0A0K2UY99_LEPSM
MDIGIKSKPINCTSICSKRFIISILIMVSFSYFSPFENIEIFIGYMFFSIHGA